jgi:L,D-peptidoglycan transpeptidase YkuD (ErfK/YbiS/YcfS/YnhG family)
VDLLLPRTMTVHLRTRCKKRQFVGLCLRLGLCAGVLVCGPPSMRADHTCPSELNTGTQVMLVEVTDVSAHLATATLFDRPTPSDAWRQSAAMPAIIGRNGFGWSWHSHIAHTTPAPTKREGDGRTPGGFFPLGHSFGFEASSLPGYVRLRPGQEFCVSDATSPYYNQVLSNKPATTVVGEDMGAIDLYRRGLFIDYPSSNAERGGSCIFVHVWRSASAGTSGCVALSQANVEAVQRWVRPKQAFIAILPQAEAQTVVSCLRTTRPEPK